MSVASMDGDDVDGGGRGSGEADAVRWVHELTSRMKPVLTLFSKARDLDTRRLIKLLRRIRLTSPSSLPSSSSSAKGTTAAAEDKEEEKADTPTAGSPPPSSPVTIRRVELSGTQPCVFDTDPATGVEREVTDVVLSRRAEVSSDHDLPLDPPSSSVLLQGLRLAFTRPGTPKLYVGTVPVGGFGEVSLAMNDGSFETLLDMAGASYPKDQPLFFNSTNYRLLCRAARRMLHRLDWKCVEGELVKVSDGTGAGEAAGAAAGVVEGDDGDVGGGEEEGDEEGGGGGGGHRVDGPWSVRLRDGQIRHHVDASSIRFIDLPGGTWGGEGGEGGEGGGLGLPWGGVEAVLIVIILGPLPSSQPRPPTHAPPYPPPSPPPPPLPGTADQLFGPDLEHTTPTSPRKRPGSDGGTGMGGGGEGGGDSGGSGGGSGGGGLGPGSISPDAERRRVLVQAPGYRPHCIQAPALTAALLRLVGMLLKFDLWRIQHDGADEGDGDGEGGGEDGRQSDANGKPSSSTSRSTSPARRPDLPSSLVRQMSSQRHRMRSFRRGSSTIQEAVLSALNASKHTVTDLRLLECQVRRRRG